MPKADIPASSLVPAASPMPGHARDGHSGYQHYSESHGRHDGRDVYDEHPQGFAILTETRVSFLLTAGDRLATAPTSELFDRMMAYSGRYRMEGDRIITTVDSAWHPSWLGTEQTRYFKLDGDALSLMSDYFELPKFPGRHLRGTAIWRREV